jgi:hypothetical protein
MRRAYLLALPLVAALAVAGTTVPAGAATGGTSYTWVGSSQTSTADNHSWTDERNWSPQGMPGDGDS